MSKSALAKEEKRLDKLVSQFGLLRAPFRIPSTALIQKIHLFAHGESLGSKVFRRDYDKALSLASRLSYLIDLLEGCPEVPIDASATEVQWAIQNADNFGVERITLLGYGHFCEIMPDVHKGVYDVEELGERSFRLKHKSDEYAEIESLDTLLTELSLTFLTAPPPTLYPEFSALTQAAPNYDRTAFRKIAKQYFDHYQDCFSEAPLVSDEAMHHAIGVRNDGFSKIRAALFAIADLSIGLAMSVELLFASNRSATHLENEVFEWRSPFLKAAEFFGFLAELTGIPSAQIEAAIVPFTVRYENGKVTHGGGDGFFPPLIRLAENVLFNPDLLKIMLPARNIAYYTLKRDQRMYDEVLSPSMEPQLIKSAIQLLEQIPGVVVVANVNWDEFEIDLIVYDPITNFAWHTQAKAPIPPQGARMVARVESRVSEGLKQLNVFRNLPSSRKDEIISNAVGIKVEGVQIVDVLLIRSNIGTQKVWKQLGDVVPLTLAGLSHFVAAISRQSTDITIGKLATFISEFHRSILKAAKPQWKSRSVLVGDLQLDVPLLSWDTANFNSFRRNLTSVE